VPNKKRTNPKWRIGSPEFRFWRRVDEAGECLVWTGSLRKDGYGRFSMNNTIYRAHRVSFFLTNGFWPLVCMHLCDNPSCVNPLHLLDGTQKDNLRDMSAKGRSNYQQHTHCAKGHIWNEQNTRIDKYGHRKCRPCNKVWRREQRAKQRLSYV
jgi:hypothetical protein